MSKSPTSKSRKLNDICWFWQDTRKVDMAEKITDAIQAYQRRFDAAPAICYVRSVPAQELSVPVYPDKLLQESWIFLQ